MAPKKTKIADKKNKGKPSKPGKKTGKRKNRDAVHEGDKTLLKIATVESAPLSLLPIVKLSTSRAPLRAYRVMWDWEIDEFEGDVRGIAPAPCVFRCGERNNNLNGHYTMLNKEWQFFWFDLCCHVVFDCYHQELSKKEYDWLAGRWTGIGGNTTAFTNEKGLDTLRNYVTGERMNKDEAAIYTLVCGGATITGAPVKNDNGKWMLKVDHFDGEKPPPPVKTIDPYTDPRVFFANIISNKKAKGGFKVFSFPQLKRMDVPIPLIASRDIYYPMDNLIEIETVHKTGPYFP
jgi:hypothetical protein